jgi:hypothetical protein
MIHLNTTLMINKTSEAKTLEVFYRALFSIVDVFESLPCVNLIEKWNDPL